MSMNRARRRVVPGAIRSPEPGRGLVRGSFIKTGQPARQRFVTVSRERRLNRSFEWRVVVSFGRAGGTAVEFPLRH